VVDRAVAAAVVGVGDLCLPCGSVTWLGRRVRRVAVGAGRVRAGRDRDAGEVVEAVVAEAGGVAQRVVTCAGWLSAVPRSGGGMAQRVDCLDRAVLAVEAVGACVRVRVGDDRAGGCPRPVAADSRAEIGIGRRVSRAGGRVRDAGDRLTRPEPS